MAVFNSFNQIVSLLKQADRYRIIVVLLLTLFLAIAEVAGVGAIFAFVKLATSPELLHDNEWLNRIYTWSGLDEKRFIIYTGGMVVVVFLLKNSVYFLSQLYKFSFAHRVHYEITLRMLARYLATPYDFLITRNDSQLGHRLLVEADRAVSGVLIGGMSVFSDVLIALGIVALLMWHDVMLALSASFILAFAYGLIYLSVKRKYAELGVRVNTENIQRYAASRQAFEGVKEVQLNNVEQYFLDRFDGPALAIMKATTLQQTLHEVPKNVIETITFSGIVLFILFAINEGGDFVDIIPTISLYALGAYRLMPSLNNIVNGINQMRFSDAAAKGLIKDLQFSEPQKDIVERDQQSLKLKNTIELEAVSYSYPGSSLLTIDSVSLVIDKGAAVALVGPTGAGKSTLIDLIIGILTPTKGRILIDHKKLTESNKRDWYSRIGYVSQSIFLFDDTIASNIAFGIPEKDIDEERLREAAREAQIDKFIEEQLPRGYATRIGERGVRLSGGQRQRIGIARALYRKPDIIVFDEATSALDGWTESMVQEAIAGLRKNHTIIVVAHRLSTVEDCDNIFFMESGRINNSGTYSELLESSKLFRAMALRNSVA